MRRWIIGLIAVVGALLALALAMPVEVRHSAPFGFRQTLDRTRGIAVDGIAIESNYPNFNRVDLDLRAYTEEEQYDLTVTIRPVQEGAEPIRTVHINRPFDAIRVEKGALANPFTTVRFEPIADSEGKAYYVWVELGPRNDDAVVALWSVKSYSRVRGAEVLAALAEGLPGGANLPARLALGGAMLVFVVAAGVLIVILGREAWINGWSSRRAAARAGDLEPL
ncbi:MAG TPA: hypothetical protein VGR16_08595 [Thermomicrobiales bacterium]|nr:hypothetical protein [Thermomicrobiales bacterium]